MEERLEERSGDLGLRLATRDLEHHPAPASAQPTSAAAVSRASPISPSSATVPLPVRLTRTESSRSVIVAPKLDEGILKRLRRWIVAFAVVEFDLDMGPDLANLYPPVTLPDALQANIAFSSLPEGDMPTAGAHVYSWRIPIPPPTLNSGKDPGENGELGELAGGPTAESSLSDVDGFLYGFVYFVQEKNDLLRRGYSQRSLVLISHLPSLVGLFSSTISILGPLFFKPGGSGMVEAACYNIAAWPNPTEGATIDLPLLGTVQTVEIPLAGQPQWASPPTLNHQTTIPAAVPLTPLSTAFHAGILSFSKILLLWELILLGEPILVFSNDPRTGSELVHHLRNMIRPIIFAGDYRPFFHIHDQDFARLANFAKPPSGTIVAATNPLVLSTCKGWPNVLRASIGGKVDTGLRGLKSQRKRHLKKDPIVAKAIDRAFSSGDYVASDALIFKHLATLTEQFLSPLNRYFGTLPSTSTALSLPPLSRAFLPTAFLLSLKSHGTPLQFRTTSLSSASSTAERFYLRFLESPNFASWLRDRSDKSESVVRRRYLERLGGVELGGWIGGREKEEVEELVERLDREAVLEERAEGRQNGEKEGKGKVETRSGQLRRQVERLRMLRDERSGAESEGDSDAPSSVSGM